MIKKLLSASFVMGILVLSPNAMDLIALIGQKAELVRQARVNINQRQIQEENAFMRDRIVPLEIHWSTCTLLTENEILEDKKNKLDNFYLGELPGRNNPNHHHHDHDHDHGLKGRYRQQLESLAKQLVSVQNQQYAAQAQHNARMRISNPASPSDAILAQLQVEFPFTPNYILINGEIRHKDWIAPTSVKSALEVRLESLEIEYKLLKYNEQVILQKNQELEDRVNVSLQAQNELSEELVKLLNISQKKEVESEEEDTETTAPAPDVSQSTSAAPQKAKSKKKKSSPLFNVLKAVVKESLKK